MKINLGCLRLHGVFHFLKGNLALVDKVDEPLRKAVRKNNIEDYSDGEEAERWRYGR